MKEKMNEGRQGFDKYISFTDVKTIHSFFLIFIHVGTYGYIDRK